MGLLGNVRQFADPVVLGLGGLYTLMAVVAMWSAADFSMTMGFNPRGALRVDWAWCPRGEVASSVAGIGMASGVLDDRAFGITFILTLASTVVTPPLLSLALNSKGRGNPRRGARRRDDVSTVIDMPNHEIADVVMDSLLRNLEAEASGSSS
jgi:Kef-type K+ transport system membrane component KefB